VRNQGDLWNSIDTEGAQALSVALPQCTALSRLYLDANYTIGDEGAQSLSEVLPHCSVCALLSKLNLHGEETLCDAAGIGIGLGGAQD